MRIIKKYKLIMGLVLFVLLVVTQIALANTYIGNKQSRVFHYLSCPYVRVMPEKHKVYFESREESVSSGYHPCKVCKP